MASVRETGDRGRNTGAPGKYGRPGNPTCVTVLTIELWIQHYRWNLILRSALFENRADLIEVFKIVNGHFVMPKNRPYPAGAYKLCHMWLKRLKTKIATLAMITQRRLTYASHMDFDSFTVLTYRIGPPQGTGSARRVMQT